jgi:hypothetical protein
MAFASNLAAMNAAKKFMKEAGFDASIYREYFAIEKHDGEWHAQQIAEFPAPREPHSCLISEREGIYPFPNALEAAGEALTEAQDDAELAAAMAEAERLANSQQSGTTVNGKEWIRISSVQKPTKFVWHVADEMNARAAAAGLPAPTRKEVQDECIRRGVASGTARTQYQAWKKARDESQANAVHAAELSARFNSKQK